MDVGGHDGGMWTKLDKGGHRWTDIGAQRWMYVDICGHRWIQVDADGQSKQDVLLNRVERSYLEDSSY